MGEIKYRSVLIENEYVLLSHRDWVLHNLVESGEITSQRSDELKRSIPEDATYLDTERAAKPQAEGILRESGEPSFAPLQGPQPPRMTEGQAAARYLAELNLINGEDLVQLNFLIDDGHSAKDVFNLAAYTFEISPDELARLVPSITSPGQIDAEGPGALQQARGKARGVQAWGGEISEAFNSFIGNFFGIITGKESEDRKRREEELVEYIETFRGNYDIADSTIDRLKKQVTGVAWPFYDRNVLGDEGFLEILDELAEYKRTDDQVRAGEDIEGQIDKPPKVGGPRWTSNEAEERRFARIEARAKRPSIDELPELNTLQDYAIYEGIIPTEQQIDLVVDHLVPVKLESGLEGDFPSGTFPDAATGQLITADRYARLLAGKLALDRGYQDVVGQGGVIDEFRQYALERTQIANGTVTPSVRNYNERARRLLQGGSLVQRAFLASEKAPAGADDIFADFTIGESAKVPTLFPNLPWERETSAYPAGSGRMLWDSSTTERQRYYHKRFKEEGLDEVTDEHGRHFYTETLGDSVSVGIMEKVAGYANGADVTIDEAITLLGDERQRQISTQNSLLAFTESLEARLRAAAAQERRFTYNPPPIPDTKSIALDVKARFRQQVGRDPSPVELQRLAQDLTGYHEQTQQALIRNAYTAWQNFGDPLDSGDLETVGIPGTQLTSDIDDAFSSEINLNRRREVNSDAHNRIMRATRGSIIDNPVVSRSNVVRL